MTAPRETIRLRQLQDYQFDVEFGAAVPVLRADEPPPLGQGSGPSPVQLLAAAVGNCLSASLLFALRKFKQQPEPIGCEVTAEVGRNAEGRLRVLGMEVRLTLGVEAAALQQLPRVLDTFEGYCTVTQSVRGSIPVALQVFDAAGARLK
ncbi:MAG: OsmC family protein [Rubrivivax sp.]